MAAAGPGPIPPAGSPSAAAVPSPGKIGVLVGGVLLAVIAAGAGYVLGQSGGNDSPDSPLTLAALTSRSWTCTDADGRPYKINVWGGAGQGPATVEGSDGSSSTSIRAEQSGDADLLALANGLLDAMGEQGSVSLTEGGGNPLTLSWEVQADRVRLSMSDSYSSSEVTCRTQP